MAPSQKQIARLVDHVYGPYPDNVLLSETFPAIGKIPVLRELQMLCDNKPIGFDETEYIIKPPVNSRLARCPEVVFSGVLEIESLDWLSEQGLQYLDQDFKDYDSKINLQHNLSNLSLKNLYGFRKGEGSRINVKVVCSKMLLAAYMTSTKQFETLIVYAKEKKRKFAVHSLHVSTFQMSRNFLDRYQIRAAIVELKETDPNNTPTEDVNIEWLINRYMSTIVPRDASNRIIADPEIEFGVSTERRFLRHISRADIRGYFASQAEWILANQLAASSSNSKNARLLDIPQWIDFCREVRKDRVDAEKNGIVWGLPHGADVDLKYSEGLASTLAKYGETQQFWANKLKQPFGRKKIAKSRPRTLSPEIPLPIEPLPLRQFQYDSDFSEESSAESWSSEPTSPSIPVPDFCFQAPEIPNGRFVWHCPGCRHKIDLLKMSSDNMDHLPDDTVRILGGKSWKVKDEPIQRLLRQMVSNHYKTHLAAGKVELVQTADNKWYLQDHQVLKEKASGGTRVKEEAFDGDMVQLRRSNREPCPKKLS
ncbi:hypothetical protein B0H34DRAFT_689485 [Crassisporium funariophilum]|nr:hypothetical protein B0H34DRAFT_689485 [Crassisporium funariophilum]